MDIQKKRLRSERMDEKPCRKGWKTRASAIWVLPHYQYCQCLFTLFIVSKTRISDIRKSGSEKYKVLVLVCFSESCLRVTEAQLNLLEGVLSDVMCNVWNSTFSYLQFSLVHAVFDCCLSFETPLAQNLSKKLEALLSVLSKIFHLPNQFQILCERTEFVAGWKIRGFSDLTDPNSARKCDEKMSTHILVLMVVPRNNLLWLVSKRLI